MENSITGLGIPAPATLTNAERGSGLEHAGDVRSRIADRIEARGDRRIEHIEDRSVRMQDRYAALEEKAQASGYEHLASGIEYRTDATASRRMQYAEHIASVNTRSEELIATLQSPPTAEGLVEAVGRHAQETTARLDAFNADVQERIAAASEQAMEAGHEQFADRLSDRAERLDGRIDTRTDNILNRAAEFIDRIESRESSLPDEGVDLHA